MAACSCCSREDAKPIWEREHIGQIVRGELHLRPDAALCEVCWRVIYWTMRQHWIAEGTTAAKKRFDDCGKD